VAAVSANLSTEIRNIFTVSSAVHKLPIILLGSAGKGGVAVKPWECIRDIKVFYSNPDPVID